MIILGFACILVFGFIFSFWTWNRCLAVAGKATVESGHVDYIFAIGFALFFLGIKFLFF